MEGFTPLFRKFCKTRDSKVEKEIINIVKNREISPLAATHFYELTAEVRNLLNSNDCKIVSHLFLLLQQICEEAVAETADILQIIDQTYTHNSAVCKQFHHTDPKDCMSCEIIQNAAKYLSNQVLVKLVCPHCKNIAKFYAFQLCNHVICKSCWIRIKHDLVKLKMYSYFCPIDNTCLSRYKLTELKDKDFKELKLVGLPQEEKAELKHNETQCPKCRSVVDLDIEMGGLHAKCEPCDYIFCSNCLRPFHGFAECEINSGTNCSASTGSDANSNLPAEVIKKSETKDFQLVRQSSGADAMDHETSFYENPLNKNLPREEVNAAFDFEEESIAEKEWPWEIERHASTRIYKYPAFKSLEPHSWVEDELLENAIKFILQQNNLTDTYTILETFVIKYGSLQSDDDQQLIGMLSEKKIPSKKIVLALINTDFENHGGHWLLGCVQIDKKKIIFFDSSIVMSPTFYRRPFFVLLKVLQVAYELEEAPFDPNKWKLIVALNSVQQKNAFDCGPIVVCNAYAISQCGIIRKELNSRLVRDWLLDILLQASEKAKDGKGEVEKATDALAVTRDEKIAEFSPKRLKIEFAFIPSSHFLYLLP